MKLGGEGVRMRRHLAKEVLSNTTTVLNQYESILAIHCVMTLLCIYFMVKIPLCTKLMFSLGCAIIWKLICTKKDIQSQSNDYK